MVSVFHVREPSYALAMYWVRLLICNMDSIKVIMSKTHKNVPDTRVSSQRYCHRCSDTHILVKLYELQSMLNKLLALSNTKLFLSTVQDTHMHATHYLFLIRVNISWTWWALVPSSPSSDASFLPHCGFWVDYSCFNKFSMCCPQRVSLLPLPYLRIKGFNFYFLVTRVYTNVLIGTWNLISHVTCPSLFHLSWASRALWVLISFFFCMYHVLGSSIVLFFMWLCENDDDRYGW